MLDLHSPDDLVYVTSTSAASLPSSQSSAVSYTLAGLMKDGVLLVVDTPQPVPVISPGIERTAPPPV